MKLSRMKAAAMVAPVALAVSMPAARGADPHAEIMEWVIEPCMEVAAALAVTSYEADQIEMGIKRQHIAELMTASRDAATRDVASKMKAGASWEARRAVYPVMLQLCVRQLPGMK